MAQNKKNNKKKTPKWNSNQKGQDIVKAKEVEMFLMLVKEVDAKNIIDALKEKGLAGLDVWESMNVFNIEVREGDGIDFEAIDIQDTFVDSSDLSFIKNREIHTIFSFSATENQIEALKPYMKEITDLFGGFACSDSEDFQPMVEV